VIVVPNCIDLGEYPPERSPLQEAEKTSLDVPPDAFRIGFVGRLHPQKGLDFLLQAMQMIRDRLHNAMLFIIGDGELRRSLENQTREYGLQHIVSFLGTSQDIPSLLYSLNLFVLPSLWEGMPVALLEAMAAGLPVVATSVGGVPEVVLDGETGFLVPPGNPEALGQAILALYEQPELRIHMGLAGKQRVQNCFSSETVTRNLELIYQELLEEKQWLPRRA
jgi:glycosyltransferase involved in cell wall biosynthesis